MDSQTLIHIIQEWLHLKDKATLDGRLESPMPAEILSADQMERYGITLALSHELVEKSVPDMLLARLSNSEAVLKKSCEILNKKTNNNNGFSPAREWLLDNFYLIQEQIHSIRRNLPKGYGRSLPQLAGNLAGYPRIYDIALQIIEHGDGRWDLESLSRFLNAYQGVTTLTLGELWATPITLGVALIENLSSASKRIVADRNDRFLADEWADRMTDTAETDPKKIVLVIADMARSSPPMSPAFVAELARRLRGTALALPLTWVEQHLAEEGLSIAQLVQEENKQQATNQVTISNSIAGLRHLAEVDWRDFVESMSIVEKTLRKDPSNTYAKMDFGTRDMYRHVIERTSRKAKRSEEEVAEATLQLAKIHATEPSSNNQTNTDNIRYSHVGYYLIDKGYPQLVQKLNVPFSIWDKCSAFLKKNVFSIYYGSIVFIIIMLTMLTLHKAVQSDLSITWLLILTIIIVICASQLAVALVNLFATLLVKPVSLPRMDYSKGIETTARGMVVVPAMLGSLAGIETLLEALEVRFLGNRDKNLYFALLTDFNDADSKEMPNDESLLTLAKEGILALNERYSTEHNPIFFLFHRPRQWNESEQKWMGFERKRGKLTDFNNLLRGDNLKPFSCIIGETSILNTIRYVITLDSDTQLSRESASQMIATMAHPLNRPRYDKNKNIVIEGYGILQPRIAETLPSSGPSRYVWLYGQDFGIDPYTRTVSDVYQDLFQEGSFIGKGIYDVDVFQEVLENRLPNNKILSHDLLEGNYLRSGLLSDVPLYEKTPNCYLIDVKRRIRWIRGDWQLLDWLFPFVLNAKSERVPNPLSLLSKIKILDNLRRSLVPVALLSLLIMSWTLLPQNAFWLDLILTIILLPPIINTILELLRKPNDTLTSQHIAHTIPIIRRRAGQLLFYLACLPFEAGYSLIAILCTLYRMKVSKRHLLEWTPSDQIKQHLQDNKIDWFFSMWQGPAMAFISMILLLGNQHYLSFFFAIPLLILWFSSPLIAQWLSKPFQNREPKLQENEIQFLHLMARKTWGFFETFMTDENHWLPPDNYQEAPIEALARRSSPTNMGLALLANLSAFDFGYITQSQLLDRTHRTLETMQNLERYRDHFYNWYSTETLKPLFPRYISTVDSGNLAGHLLTLRQGLLTLIEEPLLNPRYLSGLQDTCFALESKIYPDLLPAFNSFRKLLKEGSNSFNSWNQASSRVESLVLAAEKMNSHSETELEKEKIPSQNESATWTKKVLLQCQAIQEEIKSYANLPGITEKTCLKEIAAISLHNPSIKDPDKKIIKKAMETIAEIHRLADMAFSLAQMDISFLNKSSNNLMTIGFNVEDQKQDNSSYDLLSSEARLGNFVAIAQGQVTQESWFALGRLMVASGGEPILLSWSGSMFEYLMPLLVMPTYPETLLDQTYRTAVNRQIAYGKRRGVPWGISESGYHAVDTQFNYLYRAFGVPGLGLKRGLEEDLVVAPYASAMALMVTPDLACQNLQRLASEQAVGQYGFYEAIDYTPARLHRDNRRAIVRSFMTHHQGMTLLAFSYLLHEKPMQKRFMADPLFQSTLLLLQEKIPKPNASYLKIPKSIDSSTAPKRPESSLRVFTNPNTRYPEIQLLSNGRYHLVLTQAGGSYSRWKDLAVTRWREDGTTDHWGLFNYIRDLTTGAFCSTIYQPTKGSSENFKAVFSEGHAEYSRTAFLLEMHTEVVVSPEDDIELRRLRIHNRAKHARTIEFTSYGEIVIATQSADLLQPAFSNLFVETELLPDQKAILATRRPQDEQQKTPWLFHLLNIYDEEPQSISFETDRARFIGRGKNLSSPEALNQKSLLSNTSGAVLDPIFSIRAVISIEAEKTITFDLLTGMADTRLQALDLVEKYKDKNLANRIFGLAWTHGQVLLHQLNISEADAQVYLKLASAIIYMNNNFRAEPRILINNRKGQPGLWSYSISGDIPIVLLEIEEAANIELVRQLIQAQAYWRRKGLAADLVIINKERVSYRENLQEQIMSLISSTANAEHLGCIVLRNADQISIEDNTLLQSVARVVLSDKQGSLSDQLNHQRIHIPEMPILKPIVKLENVSRLAQPVNPYFGLHSSQNLSYHSSSHSMGAEKTSQWKILENLEFFNGIGGFNKSADEYIIYLREGGPVTPAPWANIIANSKFGTLVSESGQGYTWSYNAHEFRLSPWDNDPVQDSTGEAFYIRDDITGYYWSPTALPCRGKGDYITRHGFGYTIFEHKEEDVFSELCVYVAQDTTVKFSVLKLRNDSEHYRRLSVMGYVAWVLGDTRSKNAMHVITELSEGGAVLAQNHYNSEFNDKFTFFDAITSNIELNFKTVTGDRAEFLGRNGGEQKPAALLRKRLSGRVGAGFDPCAAIQLSFDLAPGKTREIIYILGAGQDRQEVLSLIEPFQRIEHAQVLAHEAFVKAMQFWQQTLFKVKVQTPDSGLNILANGWLLYQVLSSRLWGRTGYYQSSGAFGYRDQLQDVMSLPQVAPELFRSHIVLCAAHQFEQGDVQHWWHPPSNRGIRSRCSDDYLWLPYAICEYIETTGDITILDEKIPFLQGRPLNADEESYYDLPSISSEGVSLYQHAIRSIQNGLKFGEHGLPLMGSGDWNDGMNLVGIEGKGESVWLGFFLYSVLKRFARIAARYEDKAFAALCDTEASKLRQQIELHAWDGEWYRRAYFDDGTPLGSAANPECKIDSIAQSWSVLSGAGDHIRSKEAMAALYRNLVNEKDGIIQLLHPPFDKSKPNPGYIEGYVPGIRENGGQYTHAAIWAAMAFAELGEKQMAWKLFHMINPIYKANNEEEINRYKIEPYVVAADIYSVAPHIGRGGWSWYTGSAGWLYRLIVETLLGMRLVGGKQLRLAPMLPEEWDEFKIDYIYGEKNTLYNISVRRLRSGDGKEKPGVVVDGVLLESDSQKGFVIPLQDDGNEHNCQVLIFDI